MRKAWLVSRLMTSQTGQQIVAIHILPNISRRKDNHEISYFKSQKYNIRNIFLEKSYRRCGAKVSPRSFYKKSKFSISLDQ